MTRENPPSLGTCTDPPGLHPETRPPLKPGYFCMLVGNWKRLRPFDVSMNCTSYYDCFVFPSAISGSCYLFCPLVSRSVMRRLTQVATRADICFAVSQWHVSACRVLFNLMTSKVEPITNSMLQTDYWTHLFFQRATENSFVSLLGTPRRAWNLRHNMLLQNMIYNLKWFAAADASELQLLLKSELV